MTKKEFSYPKYLGGRIRSARINLGITQERLAANVGLPRPAISQIESGKRAVDSMELIALARTLKQPVSFFLEPDQKNVPEEEPLNVLYRADEISEKDKSIVDDFTSFCRDYSVLEGLLDLRERTTLPKWRVEVASRWQAITTGREAALKLRASLAVGFGPIKNLATILENQGVKVVLRPMRKASRAWGFSITSKTFGDCIFVNTGCAPVRQNFTLAHELGHVVLDSNHLATIYSADQSPEKAVHDGKQVLVETRANAFAAEFLAPESGVKEVLSNLGIHQTSRERLSPYIANHLALHFGVSYESMLWRLVNAKVVSKQERDDFMEYRGIFSRASEEQEAASALSGEALPERYRTLALEAYRRTKISVGRLAEFLRTDLYETRELIHKFGIQQLPA